MASFREPVYAVPHSSCFRNVVEAREQETRALQEEVDVSKQKLEVASSV